MAKNVAWSATPSTSHGFESAAATMPPIRVVGASVRSPTVRIPFESMTCPVPPITTAMTTRIRVFPKFACLLIVGLRRLEDAAAQAIDGARARRGLRPVAHHHHRGAGPRASAQRAEDHGAVGVVEIPRRFVGEQEWRIVQHRPAE